MSIITKQEVEDEYKKICLETGLYITDCTKADIIYYYLKKIKELKNK